MSYILDALNKAQRERGNKQTPAYPAAQDSSRGKLPWRAAVFAGILICMAIVLWLTFALLKEFRPEKTGRPEAAEPIAARSGSAEVPAETISRPPAAADAVPAKAGAPGGLSAALTASPMQPAANSAVSNKAAEERQVSGAVPQSPAPARPAGAAPPIPPAAEKEQAAAANAAAVPKETPPVSDAAQADPLPLRDAIKKMTLNIHFYHDDETQRVVYINGKKYVKGDLVDGLYLVESIVPDGVWLRYGGQRLLLR